MKLTKEEKLEVYHKFITNKIKNGRIGDLKTMFNISDKTAKQLKDFSDQYPNKK